MKGSKINKIIKEEDKKSCLIIYCIRSEKYHIKVLNLIRGEEIIERNKIILK